ncbi:hypothetical protein [Noviherbaspirillum pedocola]|uniref:Uncharacterized protein n=1 Tax=Noviherbaspirillum pedocola TaxID=2801341 RepID=A0A934SZB3_9BURK|nr:hypothetical protein [Noviherbaspirillum pedocola]MBK4739290.1 hypothetical protein [Noviherbaspirillum pedocola]
MKRRDVRQLKRAVNVAGSGEAMQALLQRSVRFRHKKLALIRCMQAEKMGLVIDADVLSYCRQVADEMAPEDLHKILLRGRHTTAAA